MMEICGRNCPSRAAPSVTMVRAPPATASTMSRDPPSWPPGKVWISTRPPVFSLTSLAARSALSGEGCVGAWPSPQRSTAAWARAPMAGRNTPAAAAPAMKVRFVSLVMVSSVVAGVLMRGALAGLRSGSGMGRRDTGRRGHGEDRAAPPSPPRRPGRGHAHWQCVRPKRRWRGPDHAPPAPPRCACVPPSREQAGHRAGACAPAGSAGS